MNYLKPLVVLIVFTTLVINQCSGQVPAIDSIITLQTFIIKDSREVKFSTGGKTEDVDSFGLMINKTVSLDELLSTQSRVIVKSYGAGSLASSSIRGAGAAHTAVLWNGFNLQSPSHGIVDLSLIPVNFIDAVSLQSGSNGTLWGSGAIGGAIHLKNTPSLAKGFALSSTSVAGSFGERQQQINFTVKTSEKYTTTARLQYRSALNDFSFVNSTLEGSPIQKQSNSELVQKGFLQENYIKLSRNQHINFRFWYQQTNRNIPPVMSQQLSLSSQLDNSIRASSEWSKKNKLASYFIRSAWFNETIEYSDQATALFSETKVISLISEAEVNLILRDRQLLNVGVNNTYNKAFSDGYQFNPDRNRTALFASLKHWNKKQKWNVLFSARQEVSENKFFPFIPAAGVESNLWQNVKIKANFSRSYRIPTLNDLYWYPGGNPSLLPETGWNQEAGIVFNKDGDKYVGNAEFTLFNRNIKNWIIWLPQENYWVPQNIMEVWSRGTETSAKVKYKGGNWNIEVSVLGNYTISTNERAKNANDASLGKQLIYIPLYSGTGIFAISHKKWHFNFSQAYTGYRYTTSDNSEFLPPFYLSGLFLKRIMEINKYKAELFIRANNLFNSNYQVMAWRPMPGRNYQAGLTIKFN
ncbi:MAG: TonB-dependent receptor [Bacteroidetes bacterium]|nr:TonB-dependent receptor [Bacteroidota bacterium]HET6242977.1 TonB-dependent receptor [Bacteroidia bacterium]